MKRKDVAILKSILSTRVAIGSQTPPKIPTLNYRGKDDKPKSLANAPAAVAAAKEPKVYTGTKMLGIATMHKSNSVPVFSTEEATDISKMRR